MSTFYSYDKVMSYNAVISLISGARSIGKTYGAKELCIAKALRSFERGDKIDMFVYLRRYKNEIQASRMTFFADIEDIFPMYDFRIFESRGQFAPIDTRDEKKRKWHDMVWFVPLSTAQSLKGVSYHTTKTIIFDEFILEKGSVHYIRDEANAFLNFFSTVNRKSNRVRVIMLSNAVSIDNPYFITWKIRPDQVNEFTKYGVVRKKDSPFNGLPFIVAHFPEAEDFANEIYDTTRFGQFIQGTEYADYAVSNVFRDNNDRLIGDKDSSFAPQFNIETSAGTFSIWYSDLKAQYMAMERLPGNAKLFTTEPDRMDKGKVLLYSNDPLLGMLRTAYRKDALYFDNQRTRNSFLDVLK